MQKWRCKICGYIHSGDKLPESCPVCAAGKNEFEPVEEEKTDLPAQGDIKRVIIIGNGPAGIETARSIRDTNKNTELLVFSEERHHFYSRIHLSTYIGEDSTPDMIRIYPPAWYDEMDIRISLKTPVVEILPEQNNVRSMSGQVHSYDSLIIATGATPFVPPIGGINREGVFVLRLLEHGQKIREFTESCKSAVVIGGGILGIEAAASLNKKGLDVTVFELADYLMSQQLDESSATILQMILKKRGINFHTGVKVKEITGSEQVEGILLESGQKIETEMVLISAGIIPNIQLAGPANIKVNRGIMVNDFLQTNFKNIYAAGDVAEHNGIINGIWPGAVDQGIVAGKNAIGIKTKYQGTMPLHVLKIAGIDMTALGQKYIRKSGDMEILFEDVQAGQYAKLIHNGKFLLGAIMIGIPGTGFRLERILKQKADITPFLSGLEKGDWEILKKYR